MKARLILAITEQVNECEFERHYDWIDVEVLPPKNNDGSYKKCDIVGGKWLEEGKEARNE